MATRKAVYDFAKIKVLSQKMMPEVFAEIITQLVFPPRLEPNMESDVRKQSYAYSYSRS